MPVRRSFPSAKRKQFSIHCFIMALEAGKCSCGEFPARGPMWYLGPCSLRSWAFCGEETLCFPEHIWSWPLILENYALCIFLISVPEVVLIYLKLRPTWKFLSGFLCRKRCLVYVCFIYVALFVCIPVIINKGLLVENPDESGFESGCISCRFGKTSVTLNLVKALHHHFVFSQPYMERKGTLVNHAKKQQQKYHGFHLGKGLKFYILTENSLLFL